MEIDISVDEIIELHNEIIDEFGGEKGIVSISSLEFALDQIINYGNNGDFFTDLAMLLRSIALDHPFVDGNKRTGLDVIVGILGDNSLELNLSEFETQEFIINVAMGKFNSLEKLSQFLEKNSEEL